GGEIGRGGDLGYRGTEPGWSTAFNYDRDYNYGRPWRGGGYDRDFGARRGMMGGGRMDYDRDMGVDRDRGDWRSRSQTDAGDPFGDRQRHTPFRMLRGGFDRWETDRGDWGRGDRLNRLGREARYDDVDYRGWNQGIGDDPIYNASDFRRNRNRF
ncbi:MAG TPA: hypothetical protein VFQ39_04250, partial [Longimicrobium sp.]|nr:hypothetical protein [Longimicrobium sp.]